MPERFSLRQAFYTVKLVLESIQSKTNLLGLFSQTKQLLELAARSVDGIPMRSQVLTEQVRLRLRRFCVRLACRTTAKTLLFDGRNGDAFDTPITVGVMYMMIK
jgi:DNA-directed RNA polymerase beta subunit